MPHKLFVVGESSPDPRVWSRQTEYALVIAPTRRQACLVAHVPDDEPVCEIPLDRPLFLLRKSA